MPCTFLPRLGLVFCLVLASLPTLHARSTAARPNVLFIVVDDLRAWPGTSKALPVKTPRIDALARQGTRFLRAYCQQAVCNPSRASMLTGLRPQTLGIWNLQTHFRERFPDIVTLPQLFRQSGYFTRGIGKIFHNWRQDDFRGDAPSWSVEQTIHYHSHAHDRAIVDGELPRDLVDVPRCEKRDVPDEAYFDGRIAALAVEELARRAEEDRPFFLAVGFWKPHAHFNAPARYWDLHDPSAIPDIEPSTPPRDVPALALHDSREILRAFRDRPGRRPDTREARTLRHGYLAATSYVDAQIGRVLDALEKNDLGGETIVVFVSDHGFHLGEKSLWAKTSNFEIDARVPLVIRSPDHPGGRESTSLVELLDLYPTLVDLCGLEAPHLLEGRSLRPLLEDPTRSVKSAALTWHPRPAYPSPERGPDALGQSLRTAHHRYTEWRDFHSRRILARELYDHRVDPDETVNLASRADQATTLHELSRQLDRVLHPPAGEIAAIEELPDPFRFAGNQRVTRPEQWPTQRERLRESLLAYQYGRIPLDPVPVRVLSSTSRKLDGHEATETRFVLALGEGDELTLRVGLTTPDSTGPFPVIIKNESRLGPHPPILDELLERGYAVCEYVATDLDPDARDTRGPAQIAYPDHDWGTLGVWAWGGIRTVDFLLTRPEIDATRIIVTGHSRGGKTALLHGALDERVALVNANGSGAGGAAAYRAPGPDSETLELITRHERFAYWFSPRLRQFAGQVSRLPHDQHFLAALVAPRALLFTEAREDLWASPTGSQETFRAAREIHGFFGARERVGFSLREGRHDHTAEDWRRLLDFADATLSGKPLPAGRDFQTEPYPESPRRFRWRAPELKRSSR